MRKFATDRTGNVAIIVGFSIIPLIGAVGIATDTSRGYLVKSRLQSAVDAAALAGGRVFASADRDDDIQQYFQANFPSGYMGSSVTPLSIVPNVENDTVDLSAQATLPTTFMRLLGSDSVTVTATAQVTRETSRLQVVLAMDMSLSMLEDINGHSTSYPNSRLAAAQAAAHTLVNILFGSNTENDLLKIGMVPYTGKVNVTDGAAYTGYTASPVSTFTHPVPLFVNPVSPYQTSSGSSAAAWKYISPNANMSLSQIYYANNSQVPLLDPPPSDWTGCVYARYVGTDSTSADKLLGPQTVSSTDWIGWVPMGADIATRTVPSSYSGGVSLGDGMLVSGLFGVVVDTVPAEGSYPVSNPNQVNVEIAGTHTLKKKTGQSWSSGANIYWDNTNRQTTTTSSGNTLIGTVASCGGYGKPSCPGSSATSGSVTLNVGRTGDAQSGSNSGSNGSPNNVCLDTHAYANSSSSSGRTSDCADCPTSADSITPMQSTKSIIYDAITNLTVPSGAQYYTDIPDGLAWAWEVLMPTAPFTEGALPDDGTPLPPKAIVIMTDGSNTCSVGDAYQNTSGCGVGGDPSWRDTRLQAIADNIKASGVLIYSIQFADPGNQALMQSIATKDTAPYYYYAPTADDLSNAFTEIANNLSNLRLSR